MVNRPATEEATASYERERIALRYWLQGRDYHLALHALDVAERHHTGLRKDGVTPEVNHQINIALFLRTLEPHLIFAEETIATALLHDVREDYDVADAEIRAAFGDRIADAVDLLTKEFRGERRSDDALFSAMAEDPIASIVKPADRIHNQHTLAGVFSMEKISAYVDETERYLLPMIREARRRHSAQEPAYQNARFMLVSQNRLLRALTG